MENLLDNNDTVLNWAISNETGLQRVDKAGQKRFDAMGNQLID